MLSLSKHIAFWNKKWNEEREKVKILQTKVEELEGKKTQKDYYTKYSKSDKGKAARAKASKRFREKRKLEQTTKN